VSISAQRRETAIKSVKRIELPLATAAITPVTGD
jgi:hypothetical protein